MLPKHLDEKVARLQLAKLNAELTVLTEQQARYIGVDTRGSLQERSLPLLALGSRAHCCHEVRHALSANSDSSEPSQDGALTS